MLTCACAYENQCILGTTITIIAQPNAAAVHPHDTTIVIHYQSITKPFSYIIFILLTNDNTDIGKNNTVNEQKKLKRSQKIKYNLVDSNY